MTWLVEADAYGYTWHAVGDTAAEAKARLVAAVNRAVASDPIAMQRPHDGTTVEAFDDYFGFANVLDLSAGSVWYGGSRVG